MKIAYLARSIIPSRSANSIHVMKMCQAFAKEGHEVTLIVPDHPDRKEMDEVFQYYGIEFPFSIQFVSNPNIKGRLLWLGLAMLKRVKKNDPDLVYGRLLTGCFFSGMSGYSTIFESHQPIVDSGKHYELLFDYAIWKKYFKEVVVITNALKEYYVNEKGLDESLITIAPDAADQIDEKQIIPVNLGSNESFNIGYVGHMYPGKGMEIISELAKRCSKFKFHLIGGLPEDVEFWKNELKDLDNVVFYGFVPHSETAKYMVSFDVLIAPYLKKIKSYKGDSNIADWTSPLKLFEYMSAKKPIVASNLSVLKEVLRHKENTVLCPPDNIDAWVTALKDLKNDERLRNRLAAQAYADFIKNYTWDARASRIISKYE